MRQTTPRSPAHCTSLESRLNCCRATAAYAFHRLPLGLNGHVLSFTVPSMAGAHLCLVLGSSTPSRSWKDFTLWESAPRRGPGWLPAFSRRRRGLTSPAHGINCGKISGRRHTCQTRPCRTLLAAVCRSFLLRLNRCLLCRFHLILCALHRGVSLRLCRLFSRLGRVTRSPAGKISEGVEGTNQSLASEGFEEASRAGDAFLAVARSLVTDRSYLLIPAWVCLAGLVLAAALTRVSGVCLPRKCCGCWRVLALNTLCFWKHQSCCVN